MQEVNNYILGLSIGSRTIADHPGPWWLPSDPAESVSPLEMPGETAAEPVEILEPVPADDDAASTPDASEFYFANISAADLHHLTGPRQHPAPCPWCGGRLRHSPRCDDLRLSWEPSLPFGKHKGKPLSLVPLDYLEWLRPKVDGELRDAIALHLEQAR